MTLATGLLMACGGFLLGVLWMDLIFDSQAGSPRDRGEPAESVLAAISGYYHRATTTSQPMGRIIAAVMVVLVGTLVVQAARGDGPGWLLTASLVLAGGPIALALVRTVPNAVRLGRRAGSLRDQERLARAIYRDHIVCAVAMLAFLVLLLGRPTG